MSSTVCYRMRLRRYLPARTELSHRVMFLNENQISGVFLENGPSPLIHGVINIPKIGFSLKKYLVSYVIFFEICSLPAYFCDSITLENFRIGQVRECYKHFTSDLQYEEFGA
jgi:hypothetical protein